MNFEYQSRPARKVAAVLMAAVATFVAAVRGAALCLCDTDPDACGHACHVCGVPSSEGLSAGDGCLHVVMDALDAEVTEACVCVPVAALSAPVIPLTVLPLPLEPEVPPCATSPPPVPLAYCRYSIRLMPRS